jgi:hypothetical protein
MDVLKHYQSSEKWQKFHGKHVQRQHNMRLIDDAYAAVLADERRQRWHTVRVIHHRGIGRSAVFHRPAKHVGCILLDTHSEHKPYLYGEAFPVQPLHHIKCAWFGKILYMYHIEKMYFMDAPAYLSTLNKIKPIHSCVYNKSWDEPSIAYS